MITSKILKELRSRGMSKRLPCWELYKTQAGHFACWDRNDREWRAVALPYTSSEYAEKFLNDNNIPYNYDRD